MDEILSDFLAETGENLDALSGEIVAWEQAPDDRARLDGIFRFFHTVKGTCGFLDLPRLERLSHAAETALAKVRDGSRTADHALVSAVLVAIEAIRGATDTLANTGREAEGDDAALIDLLEGKAFPMPAAVPAATPLAVAAEQAIVAPQITPPTVPEQNVEVARRQATTVRVSVDLLERMMNTASELVLTRNELMQKLSGERAQRIDGIDVTLERLSTCVGDIQEDIARTRMQPIEALWAPLPRMVRTLADELDKKIVVELAGGDTELDRQLLEAMRDPIGHMLRNSADHGIETPSQRRRAGKPETGTIRISARQASSQILIEIEDDGRGLDIERLKARAVRVGLIPASEAAQMTDIAAAQIIFEPGLSTADAVTAISGRGVGMDIVRSNVERIGGTIEVESQPGKGCCFSIRVPLTLTIVPALVVMAGGETFALPQGAISEIVRTGRNGVVVETTGGINFIDLRGRRIPLISLAHRLKLDAEDPAYAVIVQSYNGMRIAIGVDVLHDHEELVVKPAAPAVAACGFFAGTSVLGDGRAILVLDVSGFTHGIGVWNNDRSARNSQTAALVEEPIEQMLLFQGIDGRRQAVPSSLVKRIVEVPVEAFEQANGQWVMQIDGQLVPLVRLASGDAKRLRLPVLLFDDGHTQCGLVADAVYDIVAEPFTTSLSRDSGVIYGVAVLAGEATELIDVSWLLQNAGTALQDHALHRPHILLLEDDEYARGLLRPLIEAAGYRVTVSAALPAGDSFDLILVGDEKPPEANGTPCLLLGKADGPLRRDRSALLDSVRSQLVKAQA